MKTDSQCQANSISEGQISRRKYCNQLTVLVQSKDSCCGTALYSAHFGPSTSPFIGVDSRLSPTKKR
ncbi:unnamed protein product [Hermetia illucens]|uniref:Uncharacterized protein n=1 Tax=Hermetia illucens TaxID=343691 RepID=A0A7R8USK0_HERIL|nr:unnamed protein product [Hermetia illucens]